MNHLPTKFVYMWHMHLTFVLCAFIFILSGCDLCLDTEIKRISSPNGKKEFVIFERNCGATTDFSLQGSTIKHKKITMTATRKVKPKKTEVIDGITIKYHANGKTIWSKGKITNGKPEGYWEWYRIDGTIKRSGYFKNGEPVDEWTTYDDDGKAYKTTKRGSN